MSAAGTDGRRLVLSPRVAIEAIEEDAVVVFHADTASRLRLTMRLYEVLRQFHAPVSVDEVAGDRARPALLRSVAALVAKGYLVPEGTETEAPPPRQRATSSHTLFQCPAVGVYGLVSFSVRQQTREIGVRRALGVGPANVVALVAWRGMVPAAVGVVAGATMLVRVLTGMIQGVRPGDPVVLVSVPMVLLAVAAAASLVPAWRALRIAPISALRGE